MDPAVADVCPLTVVSARFGYAQQRAISAYRDFLRNHVLSNPLSGDPKAHKAAQRNLLSCEAIELLTFPWRLSAFVTAAALAEAGLEPLGKDEAGFVTRRGLGRVLCAQYGDTDPEPYERRIRRYANGWLMFGLVTEVEIRDNFKELRGTALLHDLMRTYYLTLSRGASRKHVIDLQNEKTDG